MSKRKNHQVPGKQPSRLHQTINGLMLASALAVEPSAMAEGNGDETAKRNYHISSGSLSHALSQFAGSAGTLLSADARLTDGKSSKGLEGEYTVEEGFRKLLAGTGLIHTLTDNNTVTLKVAENLSQTNASTLPAVKVTGKAVYDATDTYNTEYSLPNTSTATKTDTPIMETPMSIQVVPQQVIKDQQGYQLDKALQNVSGVIDASNTGANVFMVRGFRTTDYYRDGARIVSGSSVAGQREMASLERVEVLKGPASTLYGRAEPGGIINLVPKQPLATPYYFLQQQFGSYAFYRSTADATGPVTSDGRLLYRLNLAYEDAETFREFADNERFFAAPTLRWNISDSTQANLYLEYKHSRDPMDTGAVAFGNRPVNLPRSRNLSEPLAHSSADDYLTGFDLTHKFNDNWNLKYRFNTQQNSVDLTFIGSYDLSPDGLLLRYASPQSAKTQTYYNSLDLTGKFETFGLRHTLLFGGDHSNFQQNALYRSADSYVSINIFNPVHLNQTPVVNPASDFPYQNTEEWFGFYLQDQIRLLYDVHLLAGMRYDNSTQINDLTGKKDSDKDAVSPRVGLLWQPIPQLSLYGHYVENFGAVNNASLLKNSLLSPQTGQEWEAGIKTELFGGRLTGTLAFYEVTKQNIPTKDPNNLPFFISTGEARNKGMELDVAGEIVPGWKLIGNYSYIDSKITKDKEDSFGNPIGNQGHRLYNVPYNSGSLWTTYEFQQGLLQGFKSGAGVSARGQREGDNANTFQLPGYATVNLMLGYGLKVGHSKVNLQLNIDNLLDKQFYPGSDGAFSFINIGAPRTFLGSVRVEF